MNSVRSRFTPSGCRDIETEKWKLSYIILLHIINKGHNCKHIIIQSCNSMQFNRAIQCNSIVQFNAIQSCNLMQFNREMQIEVNGVALKT